MCGRYTLTMDQEALQVALGVEGLVHPRPRYNIAPTQQAPAVLGTKGGPVPAVLRWGLVPSWADDPSVGNRLINARSETADRKPAFRAAFRSGRCLVPADGFFEWRKGPGGKTPVWVHGRGGGVLTFAGLSERWEREGDEPLRTFTILTAPATKRLRSIHDRMPVLVAPEDRDGWLDPEADPDDLRTILDRAWMPEMDLREVSRRVNSPANDDPSCLEAEAPTDDQTSLF